MTNNHMEIRQEYLPVPSLRRSGEKIEKVTYIVCHDTGNDGATADENVNYYIKSANDLQASAHSFVDDAGVIECVPLIEKAWHVRYNAGIAPNSSGNFANDHAIGIELCYTTRGNFDAHKAYQNYVGYIAGLLQKYGLDTTKLVQHAQLDPTRRTDPLNAFSKIGKSWSQFLEDVRIITSAPQAQNHMKTVIIKGISATFDVLENGVTVQSENTQPVTVTPELVSAMGLADAGLVEEGYNVTVISA